MNLMGDMVGSRLVNLVQIGFECRWLRSYDGCYESNPGMKYESSSGRDMGASLLKTCSENRAECFKKEVRALEDECRGALEVKGVVCGWLCHSRVIGCVGGDDVGVVGLLEEGIELNEELRELASERTEHVGLELRSTSSRGEVFGLRFVTRNGMGLSG